MHFGNEKTAVVSNYGAANVLVLWWTVVGQLLAGRRRITFGRKFGLQCYSEVTRARARVCVKDRQRGLGDGTEAIGS
jgi:hypothetical protein